MKKLIAVFGPSGIPREDALYQRAEELGKQLAQAGFIVLAGAYEGVMEAVAKGARDAGGSAVGVTAEVYHARGRYPNEYLSREIKVKSAVDQTMELMDLADAYIALGNSTGTFAEVILAWDFMVKKFLPVKPLLLVGESWKRIMPYFQEEPQFKPNLEFIRYCDTPTDAIARLIQVFGTQLQVPDLNIIQ
jgi:uncharacterized protein (TIGR00730 family)